MKKYVPKTSTVDGEHTISFLSERTSFVLGVLRQLKMIRTVYRPLHADNHVRCSPK